jgi:peptidoglycan/LPS O-acetylase OafA/YrhL
MRLGEVATGPSYRENNFDVLRLAAAAMVLVSHAFVLGGGLEPYVGNASWGALGVQVFFAISGFLVCRSWCLQSRLLPFVLKRALRILPALVATLVICAYVLGPLVTTLSLGDYLVGGEPLGHALQNIAAIATGGAAGGIDYTLPGVFADNPHPGSVNGSLWTLPIEVQAYVMVALLGVAGLLTRLLPAVAVGAILITLAHAAEVALPVVGHVVEARPETFQLLATFAAGGLMWLWRDRIALRLDLAAVALCAWLLALDSPAQQAIAPVAVTYLVLLAAYRTPAGLRALSRRGDVSYGLYLLAFPTQQTIVHVWGGHEPAPLTLIAVSLPITYALAFASWRLVEAPTLRRKRPLSAWLDMRRSAPPPEPLASATPGAAGGG